MSATKEDIVRRVASQTDLDAADVKRVIQLLLDGMIEALAKGERLEWRDFGIFRARTWKARKARNPKTGEGIMLGERRAVKFWAGKAMEEKVEGGGRSAT